LTDYADPDLETIAPLPLVDPPPVEPTPESDEERRRWVVVMVGLVVVALVTGFGVVTAILNATDSGSNPVSVAPAPSGGSTPPTTALLDPSEGVLDGLIVNQDDVPAAYTVHHPQDGINLAAPTLDLCNGKFPSESLRTARRQVYVGPTGDTSGSFVFSTEAVLYHASANGAQALAELRSVSAQCPPTPVVSPVGEPTATTKFSPPPDTSWPANPAVQRQAYAFVTTDPQAKVSLPSIAVYLRRGRVLMGLYFAQPNGAQVPIDGHATMQQIVAVFAARMAHLPPSVVNG
jgi:hypothetical protein